MPAIDGRTDHPLPETPAVTNSSKYFDQHTLDALPDALARWQNEAPGSAVLALVPEGEQARISFLQSRCAGLGLTLFGAVFPALIHAGRFEKDGLWLFRLPAGATGTLIDDLGGDAAAQRIADAVRPPDDAPKESLLLIFDAMVPNIASLLDQLYFELGDAFTYLGANAGSETFQPMDCLFDAGRRLGGGVLCVTLPGELDSLVTHGYQAPDEPVTATASAGNRITSIDWQPAFDVYQARIKSQYGVDLTRDNFYQYGVHFPFGISLANGDSLVRIPVGLDEQGGLHCVGEVPEYSLLTLLRAPDPDSPESVRRIAEHFGRRVRPTHLFMFYCAGRRLHLGDAAERELAALSEATGAELAGALSLGEIGGLDAGAYPHFHNGTLVCARWA